MKKLIIYIGGIFLLVLILGIFKFSVLDDDLYVENKEGNITQINDSAEDYEDVFIYEEKVDSEEDCTEFEKYNPERGVCFFECTSEEECEKITQKIDIALDELGEEYADFSKDFKEFDGDTDALKENFELEYKVEKGEKFVVVSGNENKDHIKISQWLASISPDNFSDSYLANLVFLTETADDSAAFVTPNPQNPSKWDVFINMQSYYEDGQKEMVFTLIHEFAHILTLNSNQIDEDADVTSCKTYYTQEGCTNNDSYLNKFYQKFWKGKGFNVQSDNPLDNYSKYPNAFVTEYAATNPGEDIAESFASFVFKQKPKSPATIAEEKILFFYEYPELVDLRKSVRSNLTTFVRKRIIK